MEPCSPNEVPSSYGWKSHSSADLREMNIRDNKGNFIAGAPEVKKRELKLSKEQKVEYVNTWFQQPKENRSPKTARALAKMMEVTTPTLYSWVDVKKSEEGEHDAKVFLEHLKAMAFKSNPNPRFSELYAKMAGFMEREISDEYTVTADDHFRIRREAQERLREVLGRADGNRSVFDGVEGVPILSTEVCVDNQSEHGAEDKVDAVGIS